MALGQQAAKESPLLCLALHLASPLPSLASAARIALILENLQVPNLGFQTVKKEWHASACIESTNLKRQNFRQLTSCLWANKEETVDSKHRESAISVALQQKHPAQEDTKGRSRIGPDYFRSKRITWSSLLFQDNPIGDWNGVFDGKLLCNFASLEHTRLVPICDVMPGELPSYFLFLFLNLSAVPPFYWVSYKDSDFLCCLWWEQSIFVYNAVLFLTKKTHTWVLCVHVGILVCLCMLLLPSDSPDWHLRFLKNWSSPFYNCSVEILLNYNTSYVLLLPDILRAIFYMQKRGNVWLKCNYIPDFGLLCISTWNRKEKSDHETNTHKNIISHYPHNSHFGPSSTKRNILSPPKITKLIN